MEDKRKTYKMYFLVLYNLSPIQQGIQAGHAAVEYMIDYGHIVDTTEWASYDKTFIILNGGTTDTMKKHEDYLKSVYVKYVSFQEPDLGGVTTAIAFLAADDDYILKYFTNNFRLA